jgi:hypothetical protein
MQKEGSGLSEEDKDIVKLVVAGLYVGGADTAVFEIIVPVPYVHLDMFWKECSKDYL